MKFINKIEETDTREIVESDFINWNIFKNKSFLVTGATGLLGAQIVKSLLYANEKLGTNINIIALVRNENKAREMFSNDANISYICQDIVNPIKYDGNIDFVVHTANSTSSASFVNEPVETIDSIITGTNNLFRFLKEKNTSSIVYLSSMEVYGDIPITREEKLKEDDYGYINILKPRSSYQEGKRAAECLCSAYTHEYGLPIKIARLAQTLGSAVNYNDNRVFAMFARNIVEKKDIVLKTKGETVRSYCYITDAVVAILSMLERGKDGESYNIANSKT